MKSKPTIFISAFIGGIAASFFQILKPPPYSIIAAIFAVWLFLFWANGTKPNISYLFFILPTLFFGIGCVGSTLLVCKVFLDNQVIIFDGLPLVYCPVINIQSYLSPMIWFILMLMGMLYGVRKEEGVYNKKWTFMAFVMLLIFFVLGLSEDVIRVLQYFQTIT